MCSIRRRDSERTGYPGILETKSLEPVANSVDSEHNALSDDNDLNEILLWTKDKKMAVVKD